MSDTQRMWYRIKAEKTTYAYGFLIGDQVNGITAEIERRPDGRWHWLVRGKPTGGGIEPSAEEAVKAAEHYMEFQREIVDTDLNSQQSSKT